MAKINLKFLSSLKGKISLKGSGDRDYVFIFLALLMLIIVGSFIVWSVTFLISNLTGSFIDSSPPPPVERFDIKGFEELNLIR